ncbi:MOSC domain-containing protein [Aspergillus ibericus CBS 121593]|uniref:Putative Fe-S protein n=1 Tax=Aspergillus ibericus CBS 121593 TaxID=1448316 RepID=A0A395H2F0_9EURO|nr:putative Fe-S protein [Aspergillus ibericus CBS 121593]RAL01385.1 putative Fe-S protein [Aspergillus ibericus CBS 121593]
MDTTVLLTTILAILLLSLPFILKNISKNPLSHLHTLLHLHHHRPLKTHPSTILSLHIYPIKSCRGLTIPKSTLNKHGLALDRRWMFVDANTHEFLTIRQNAKMTLITTALDSSLTTLSISIPSFTQKVITVPASPTPSWLAEHTTLSEKVKIWDNITDGYVYGPAVNSLFSEFLGREVALVYKGPTPRMLKGNGDPRILGREQSTFFPDVHPVLIASEASMRELNERLVGRGEEEITVERFRPNIVIQGVVPWEEDSWKVVRILSAGEKEGGKGKGLELDVVARCARCQVPNVHPDTAVKHAKQPWDTLMSYRRVDEGMKYKPCFGMLSAPRNEGVVEVGMRFEVVEETDQHRYITGF